MSTRHARRDVTLASRMDLTRSCFSKSWQECSSLARPGDHDETPRAGSTFRARMPWTCSAISSWPMGNVSSLLWVRRRFGRAALLAAVVVTAFVGTRAIAFAAMHAGAALFSTPLARNGYPPAREETVYAANFFPLYPLLVRAGDWLLGNTFASSLILSNACALAAALLVAFSRHEGSRSWDGGRR